MKIPMMLLTIYLVAPVMFLGAGEVIDDLDDVMEYALGRNIEYRTAVNEYLDAVMNAEKLVRFKDTEFKLSAGYTEDDPDSGVIELSTDIPVIDQLSLNASMDSNMSSVFGVSLFPLTHSDSRKQSMIEIDRLKAYLEELRIVTETEAASSFLNWAVSTETLESTEKIAELKEVLYEDEKRRYQKGESSLDAVRDSLLEWSGARKDHQAALKAAESSELALYSVLNLKPGEITIYPVDEENLRIAVSSLRTSIDNQLLSSSYSWDLRSACFDLQSREAELKNTWFFEPDLEAGFSVRTYDDRDTEISLSAGISFSFSDFKPEAIESIRRDIALARDMYGLAETVSEMNLDMARDSLAAAVINREIVELELDEASGLSDEARLLEKVGEYSAAETDSVILTEMQLKTDLISALAEEYTALRELLLFLPR